MKFCLINNLFHPLVRGGAEKVVSLIANGLRERGEVSVITSCPKKLEGKQAEDGVVVYRLNPGNFYYLLDDLRQGLLAKLSWHFFDLFNYSLCSKVNKILKAIKPDFIFTHNLKGLSLRLLSRMSVWPAQHAHTLHDYQLLEPHGSFFRNGQAQELNSWIYKIYRSVTRPLTKNCRLVIAPSDFILQKHLQYGFFPKAKAVVLTNPIFQEDLKVLKNKSAKTLCLGYLGQIEQHKGVDFLVKAFKNWPKPETELLIAGGGGLIEAVKNLTKDDQRIKILGKIKQSDLADFFQRIDVLIVPSAWWENSPTVIYEAYAYGLPVLVSDAGGSKELVKAGETGWVFKSQDQVDLLAKLDYLYQNQDQLKAIGQNGFNFIKQFSLEKYLDQFLLLCQNSKK